jgi:hypothetical protein
VKYRSLRLTPRSADTIAAQAQRIDMGRSASKPVSAAITPATPATAAQ